MGKLTYVVENSHSLRLARVVLDGTDVHASHPSDVHKLVRFENDTDKAALETFKKVVEKYFHPRDGWRLKEKRPGVADLTSWAPPPPSEEEKRAAEEEKRAAAEIGKRRIQGYAVDGDVMVLDLKRQARLADMEIAFEGAKHVTTLGIITADGDDERGAWRMPACAGLLESGALPRLAHLTLDCPFEAAGTVAQWEQRGVALILQKLKTLETFSCVGQIDWPRIAALPALRIVRVLSDPLSAENVENIAATRAPLLDAVQLGLSFEQASDPLAEAALLRLLRPGLAHLSVEGLPDVGATLDAFLASKRALPGELCVDGGVTDEDALIEALARVRKAAPRTTLRTGEEVAGALSDDAAARLTALGVEAFDSRFTPEAADERLRALWNGLA